MSLNQNNQPSCPPRLVSYDKALDHKITNQYMNNIRPIQQTSIHNQNILSQQNPNKAGSVYSNYSATTQVPSYTSSINGPNNYISLQRVPPQNGRLNNTTTGDLSMQTMNYAQPMNQNVNMLNPTLNNDHTDFNTNFYINAEKSKKLGFFDVVPNIKQMSQQNKLSKWALIFVIVQVICIVTLEALISLNFRRYYDDLKSKKDDSTAFEANFGQMKSLMIYQLIFIFSQFYVLVMYYDSFRLSSSIQLIAVSVFNFIIAIYSIVQILQNLSLFEDLSNPEPKINGKEQINNQASLFTNYANDNEYKQIKFFGFIIAGYLALSAMCLVYMSILLFKRFGWNIYRNVGADIKKTVILKRRYNFGLVMKFKFFFIFGIIIQCLIFKDPSNDNKCKNSFFSLDCFDSIVGSYAALVLTIILIINIICGYFSVKIENKFLMVIHILTDMIFIIFSIYMISTVYVNTSNSNGKYKAVKKSLTGFATIEILLLFISIYFSMVVLSDFNTTDLTENYEKNEIGRRLSL